MPIQIYPIKCHKQKTKTVDDEWWDGVWEVSAYFDGYRKPFPIPTIKKPDVVIWCTENKTVQLAELTVPHEDNIEMANDGKDERYAQVSDLYEEAGGSAEHFSIEVGCIAFVAEGLTMGFPKCKINKFIREI